MNRSEFFQKFKRPEKIARVAEIAALILAKDARTTGTLEKRICGEGERDGVWRLPDLIPPAQAAAIAEMLVQRAEALHRLAERDCNYGLTEAQEKRKERLQGEVCEIAEAVGFRAETGGDPRGAVVRLFDPADQGAGDGWSGGWPVYR